jgi:hypothetical protein
MAALEPVTIELTTPVRDFGKMIERVTIKREGVGSDLLAIDGLKTFAAELVMIHRLCGVSREAAEAMTMKDIGTISDALDPFVGRGPRAGASPSEPSPSSDGSEVRS